MHTIMNYESICKTYGFNTVAQLVEKITMVYPTTIWEIKKCMIGYNKSLLLKMIG